MLKLLLFFLIFAHWVACIWYAPQRAIICPCRPPHVTTSLATPRLTCKDHTPSAEGDSRRWIAGYLESLQYVENMSQYGMQGLDDSVPQ